MINNNNSNVITKLYIFFIHNILHAENAFYLKIAKNATVVVETKNSVRFFHRTWGFVAARPSGSWLSTKGPTRKGEVLKRDTCYISKRLSHHLVPTPLSLSSIKYQPPKWTRGSHALSFSPPLFFVYFLSFPSL